MSFLPLNMFWGPFSGLPKVLPKIASGISSQVQLQSGATNCNFQNSACISGGTVTKWVQKFGVFTCQPVFCQHSLRLCQPITEVGLVGRIQHLAPCSPEPCWQNLPTNSWSACTGLDSVGVFLPTKFKYHPSTYVVRQGGIQPVIMQVSSKLVPRPLMVFFPWRYIKCRHCRLVKYSSN